MQSLLQLKHYPLLTSYLEVLSTQKLHYMLRIRSIARPIVRRPWANAARVTGISGTRIQVPFPSSVRWYSDREPQTEPVAKDEESEHVPWYMRLEDDSLKSLNEDISNQHEVRLPDDCPDSLHTLVKHLQKQLALRDILVFDLKNQRLADPENYRLKMCDYVIICTAMSTKHCERSYVEINKLLKNEYGVSGYVEGQVNPNDEKKRLKRLARKNNLGRTNIRRNELNSTEESSWYMIDCHVDSIFLNILTENRRYEMNLEELYAPLNEKHLYEKSEHSMHINTNNRSQAFDSLEEEDNVLLALRKLAQQKRQYSTESPARSLRNELVKENFDSSKKLLADNPELREQLVKVAISTIEQIRDSTGASINTEKWYKFVSHNVPLVIQDTTFWDSYLKFLLLLNDCNSQTYSYKRLIPDYLVTKRSMGEELTADDITTFLSVISERVNPQNYWDLVKANTQVVEALRLFDEEVIFTDAILSKVIKTLTTNSNEHKLHSFYEVIKFLVWKYEKEIPINTLETILKTLINFGEYDYLLRLWTTKIGYKVGSKDTRPWKVFLKAITETQDVELIRLIIEKGCLLDISRGKVDVDPQLAVLLQTAFKTVDPENLIYNDQQRLLIPSSATRQ
ncbi:ATPase synthesis protein 25, mitochondrial [Nakaseomyces glabratus]|uniref:ATPase synthesis protein 25 n=1 Tax=Candida glabrata TaxID=5478 RepID=A0A0W0CMN8_CANGB|nr:ATPase synthesis protein 25, mitochondrial [Nakaseomyces glabratus]KTB00833.1 ATPase synthesis protein 25, mitochondrial [Nakaseomyces glabratus]